MKRIVVAGFVLLSALFAFSCGSAPAVSTGVSDPTMPPWVNEQPPADVLWGIGVADNVQMQMRMTMADSRARQDIARQLEVLAQGMVTDWAREAGGISNAAAAQFQESVSRQVTQSTLRGVVRETMWTAPDNKTLWVRVSMSKTDASRVAADEVARAIDSDAARFAEWKSMNALEQMDRQLQNNQTSPQPVRN
ncbi:MAG: hypothetical protein FWD91_08005 [Treponema sp.]|nr:hypothetical protein [Treponema sp.]